MIPLFKVHMPKSIDAPLLACLHSGYIGEGPKVKEFESLLAAYIGNPNIVTTNSGTMALQVGLRACGIGAGDRVISTPMTCSATNMAIKAIGADIIWADVDPETGLIDPGDVVRQWAIHGARAVVCVHWGGMPCELEELSAICKTTGMKLIEDAAHALGSEYRGQRIGNHGDAVCFSTQAIKHITTIEGGFVAFKDAEDARRGRLLRWFGIDREGPRSDMRCEQDIPQCGYKGNLVDPLAVIGIEQIKHVDSIVATQRSNALYYCISLIDTRRVRLIREPPNCKSAHWLFSVHVDDKDKFRSFMASRDVMVSAVHSRNDTFSCFADVQRNNLPGVGYFSAHQMAIPVHWALTQSDLGQIVSAIYEYEQMA